MARVLVVISMFLSSLAFAGGPVCKIEGTNKVVKAFTPNGRDYTMTYNDGAKDIELGVASFTLSSQHHPPGYTLTAVAEAEVIILTVYSRTNDLDESFGFVTRVVFGKVETSTVTCIEYQ